MDRPLGDVDGERPDHAAIKFTSQGHADRPLTIGERVAYTVIGEVTGISFKRVKGALIRVHSIEIETAAEPSSKLADEVWTFMRDVENQREGRLPLPLEEAADPG